LGQIKFAGTARTRHKSLHISSCHITLKFTSQRSYCLRATRTHQQEYRVAPSKLLAEDAGTHLPTDILQQS